MAGSVASILPMVRSKIFFNRLPKGQPSQPPECWPFHMDYLIPDFQFENAAATFR
jgi:hypothetical protein